MAVEIIVSVPENQADYTVPSPVSYTILTGTAVNLLTLPGVTYEMIEGIGSTLAAEAALGHIVVNNQTTSAGVLSIFADEEVEETERNSWQKPVLDKDLVTDAALTPSAGDRYIIAGIGGGWAAGTIGDIVEWDGFAWGFETPAQGDIVYIVDEALYYSYGGAAWGISSTGLCNVAATDPGAGDDSGDGYTVGSRWWNTTASREWVCIDNTLAAAVWLRAAQVDNWGAATAPTVNDDDTAGYSVGSLWIDVVNGASYRCIDNSTGAAIWLAVKQTLITTVAAGASPHAVVVDDYILHGETAAGDVQFDLPTAATSIDRILKFKKIDAANVMLVAAAGAETIDGANIHYFSNQWAEFAIYCNGAAWFSLEKDVQHNFAGATAPVATDDETLGYSVGSLWFDTTNAAVYSCADATATVAVWLPIRKTLVTPVATPGAVLTLDDHIIPVDLSGGPVAITLPDPAADIIGTTYRIKVVVAGAFALSLTTTTPLGNIDNVAFGAMPYVLGVVPINYAIDIVCASATQWYLLG